MGFDNNIQFVEGAIVDEIDYKFSSHTDVDRALNRLNNHRDELVKMLSKSDKNSCFGLYLFKKKERREIRESILKLNEEIRQTIRAGRRVDIEKKEMTRVEKLKDLRNESEIGDLRREQKLKNIESDIETTKLKNSAFDREGYFEFFEHVSETINGLKEKKNLSASDRSLLAESEDARENATNRYYRTLCLS